MRVYDVDIEQFWKDDDIAHENNCFNPEAKQIAMGIRMNEECVFEELGVEGDPWLEHSPDLMRDLTRRYNDKAEKIVGRRLLSEEYPKQYRKFPYIKRIGEVFGSRYVVNQHTEWLESCFSTPEDLEKGLDRVEALDIADFIIPDNWFSEVKRIYEETGEKPDPIKLEAHIIRGPCTAATSLFGTENTLLLYYEEPDLFERFGRVIGDVILKSAQAIDAACGYDQTNYPHGFQFRDDNSALFTPDMYGIFGYPTLKKVFEYYSPNPGDERYQHSDSAMAHILPYLGKLNMTGCNFGPKVFVDQIRKYMPNTRIDGVIAPYTFMRNDEDQITAEVKRDCEMAKASGIRGLNITTAGSINYGSLLTSMLTVMEAIQKYGRYD